MDQDFIWYLKFAICGEDMNKENVEPGYKV
jgi:hypothetical protein